MKQSTWSRRFASLCLMLSLLAAPVAVLAKKGEKNFKSGLEHEKMEQWDQAAQDYALALAANPSDLEYQLHYRRAIFSASQKFMEQGRALAEQGNYTGAYNAFRQAYGYDPVNDLAVAEMNRMLRLQHQKEGATGTSTKPGAANGDGGETTTVPASFERVNGTRVANGQVRQGAPVVTPRSEQLRVINFNGDLEDFIRKMAEELGLNVITDRDFPKRQIKVNLRDVTAARALDDIFVAQNLFFQKLDRRTILIADQSKRGQYQQLVLRTFYLVNIDPQEARNLIQTALPPNAGRQPLVTPNKATNSITVRDTPENIRLIEDLLRAIDKDRAEVVMDVSIYEVSRTNLLQLGNQIGSSASLGNLGGFNPLSILVGGPNGRGQIVDSSGGTTKGGGTKTLADATAATVITALGGSFVLPATQLSAFQSKDNTRLLAHTLVHAFDGEQSITRIGQKVPIQTAQVTPFGSVGTGTGTTTGGTNGIFGGTGFPVIQYQDTGLNLKFTPQVFPNQDVEVKMEIESNDVIGGSTALTPTFSQRTMSGKARIPNGRTVMIASVAQDKQSHGTQGLPILGLIPILGRVFSTPTNNSTNADIVITMTPRVLSAPVVTPDDIDVRPSGTLQSPISDTLEALVRDAEREDNLAAARQLPTSTTVEVATTAAAPSNTTADASKPDTAAPQPVTQTPQATQTTSQTTAATAAQTPAPAAQTVAQNNMQTVAQTAIARNAQVVMPLNIAQDALAATDAGANAYVPAPKILAGVAVGGGNSFAPSSANHAATTSAGVATGAYLMPVIETDDVPPPVPAVAVKTSAPLASAAAAPVADLAQLFVMTGQKEMRVGEHQRLMIFIKSDAPLTLAAATLKFDPRIFAVRAVEKGSLFNDAQKAQSQLTQSVDPRGSLLALVAPQAGTTVAGAGVLFFVEIEAIASGESEIGFDVAGIHLMSADGRGIATQTTPARLTVKQ